MPVYLLSKELVFPPVHLATREGLLAVGGDLAPERLLLAYRNGIFPWYSGDEPILWWSPDPRLVLMPQELKISRSLRKTIRQERFRVTLDTAFDQVIHACARLRIEVGTGTWITPEMATAYRRLHVMGYAHSVEAWCDGRLSGGLYGIALGRAFFGESMFSMRRDASKVCLVHLARHLVRQHYRLIDCQVPTDHMQRMGARLLSRTDFMLMLNEALRYPSRVGQWAEALF
ncbi:leucyl/phenylalanyl-tRNA--protein transferase [Desulfatitalea alkaliphila]|uniref:Leucyl/phenylalanyl-tRNA--protein transferase n=1 Tax=Desulfatitalea alkaliphila TaxID=2929485 RepID=A0AA41UIC7_9BACT|nr:leucyl/phenylalanyl-tRNA--protein transferase [Desulfatitalea alkaliphila]MCJ8500640.1 leucyl/phenylalanyl-tRNA--protein transferase [Desulfatitalea alkaliphila]